MSDLKVVKTRIHAGKWEGVISTSRPQNSPPAILVTNGGRRIRGVAMTKDARDPCNWKLAIDIPPEFISDGVQVFVITDDRDGAVLDSFAVVTGEILEDDVRSEVHLLRAELDMLKRVFRGEERRKVAVAD